MDKRKALATGCAALAVAAVVTAGAVKWVKTEGAGGKEAGTGNVSYEARALGSKTFDEEAFRDPDVKYRPLRILHESVHSGVIKKLKDLGYGGLVTNVEYKPFSMYLQAPDYWRMLKQNVSYAIDTLGLRVWLYDELGWPSGAAGGLVLKERPDLEAQGLAVVTEETKGGGEIEIVHPQGHGSVVSAVAYRGTESTFEPESLVDLTASLDEGGSLKWKPADDESWVVFYFVQKPFYEGTHAAFNWFEQRRYPNLLEEETAAKFVEVTHEQYRREVGEYFGSGIEAFFTDEPSLLGTYFTDEPPVKPVTKDEPDPDFPLLLTLNWGNRLAEQFRERRGYDLLLNLPLLVTGDGEKALRTRWDYYRTLSETLGDSYFGTLEKFGDDYGVASSGHLLLEENLYHQAVFEGDLIQLYRRMHIPGIDMLTSYPEQAKDWGVTVAKLASSAASLYGRERVMSEISSAFDAEDGGLRGRLGAAAVQYAYGVDTFNSYYRHETMSDEDNRAFTDYLGRIGYMLDGGASDAKLAVYYPIESVWARTLPPMTLHAKDFAREAVALSDNFKQVSLKLVERQADFDYIDSTALLESKADKSGWIVPGGKRYEALLIPSIDVLDTEAMDRLEEIADAGTTLIVQGDGPSVAETGADSGKLVERFRRLLQRDNVRRANGADEAAEAASRAFAPAIELSSAEPSIVARTQRFADSSAFLFVNTSRESRSFQALMAATGQRVRLWNPETGEIRELSHETEGSRISAELTMEGWQAVVVTVEP
ncbi:glycosyl hydrolase [Cohnella phaseoli]|uniref:Alpha-L-rhamnosidase-like protein n=1 Tax=Cohnella phaseoli TaxID=456490 RepID=A0A3D9HR56_9BACL|nr:glycosyl hydrolase [Cohnella phaseoli]RED51972.1 alpha-L-rhamnosidase-like protein [Cohnella phaseoli]